ncbi:MAG: tRNA (adenosine(37)-N6)-dimethylallyltransferase MiaA [Muribaculaceae bacterium]|nr:tRNA (adenosine(37)-N6)-dimethylallyltransferase MiaA [Muribaculaceae bacterium]
MNTDNNSVIVITGPTASGKSALAVDMALRLDGEVVSADSRQLYKDIPIVTAAPTEEEMRGVPHHLVGTLSLEENYSAARFEQEALAIIRDIHARGKRAIVCGGSMMYIDALCNGIDELPDVPEQLRADLMEEWKQYGDASMRLRLLGLDPDYYARVDLDNMKRVFHAVEMSIAAGQPYSTLLTGKRVAREFPIEKIFIDMPREKLFDRINRRVLLMMETGLEEEARKVYPLRHLNSLNTVGLKEMFAYFDGTFTLEEAIARIQKNTRVYAKKQITWHKKTAGV